MVRTALRVLLSAALLACALPGRAADPVLMLLLSAAREVALAAARKHLARPASPAPENIAYAGTAVEPAHLKRIIDEGFTYLSDAQRQEIFESLHATLLDPKNAAVRGPMIEYFAQKAIALRQARERLARLSQSEKELLAADFRKEIADLPEDEATRLADLLHRQLLPVPSDLNEMLLAALRGR